MLLLLRDQVSILPPASPLLNCTRYCRGSTGTMFCCSTDGDHKLQVTALMLHAGKPSLQSQIFASFASWPAVWSMVCLLCRTRTNLHAFTDDSHGLSVHQTDLEDHRESRVDPDVDHTLRCALKFLCSPVVHSCSRMGLACLWGQCLFCLTFVDIALQDNQQALISSGQVPTSRINAVLLY